MGHLRCFVHLGMFMKLELNPSIALCAFRDMQLLGVVGYVSNPSTGKVVG